jgi:uncharacterized protein (UPF0332 family)
MNARTYLVLAELLIQDISDRKLLVDTSLHPAACRSAISRAYYAAFMVAIQFLNSIKLEVGKSPQAHVTVHRALNNSGNVDLQVVGNQLGTLYSERLTADYEPLKSKSNTTSHATIMVTLAKSIINDLESVLQSLDQNQTQQSILAWAKLTQSQVKSI